MRQGFTFLRCPGCHCHGVWLKLGQEDWYQCRYCNWTTSNVGEDEVDRNRRAELAVLNPDKGIWVTDLPS